MAAFNFHKRQTRRWWYVGTTLLVAAFLCVFYVGGAFAVNGSPSGFESSDGNMVLDNTNGSHTDWNCFVNSDGFAKNGATPSGCAKTSGAKQVSADLPASVGEITWTKGQKFDTQCPTIATKSTPPKDDFTNVAEFDELAPGGDLFFYGASIRSTANGNSSGDVEFNQAGTFAGNGTFGCRTLGDRLIAYDFLNGGTSLDFHSVAWITCSSTTLPCGTVGNNAGTCLVKTNSPPCWGANVIHPSSTEFDGQANQAAVAAADNGLSGSALVAQQFAEFGVNLTQALGGGPLPCFPQQVWESRSSGSSFVSSPEDLEFVNLNTCGSITVAKNTLDGTGARSGVNQNFSFSASGGSISPTSFKLNDQTAVSALSISSISTGTTSSSITTTAADGFATAGDKFGVTISGSNSTPSIDGSYTATAVNSTHFTIPLAAAVTTAGTAGSVTTNTEVYPEISAGSYTVNEPSEPSGFTFVSLTCSDSNGNSTTVASGSTTANITVAAGGSTVCTYVNQENTAALTTQQSTTTTTVFPGVSVNDTATVTGNQSTLNPSGTVTFYLCGPSQTTLNGCSSSDTSRTNIGTGTLSGSGGVSTATSPNVNCAADGTGCTTGENPLAVGNYCFEAKWPGDSNYPGALDETSATNECFAVKKDNTQTVTTPSDSSGVSESSIILGDTIYDKAVVTGTTAGGTPTGNVVFHECGPIATGNCSTGGTLVGTSTGVALGAPTTATTATAISAGFAPTATGRYCFRGEYGGSLVYNSSSDPTNTTATNECFTVTQITTTTTTTPSSLGFPLSGNVNFGDQTIYDHAVVQANTTGGTTPTGSVAFTLCSPSQMLALSESTCITGGTAVGTAVTLGSDLGISPPAAAADSIAFTNGGSGVNQTGTWCWRGVYSPTGSQYTGSSDTSIGECFTVVDTFTATSAQTWLPNDSGTVTATNKAPLNGTLSIQLYTSSDCSTGLVSGQEYDKTLTNATTLADRTVTSNNTTFTVSTSSSVSWKVTFTSSDPNVTGTSTHCESSSLTINN